MNELASSNDSPITAFDLGQLAPGHSHACVALALGYQRAGELPRAKEYTMQALAADPRNPVALKNLGAILGNLWRR